MRKRDHTLDQLLELDGQVLVIDEAGYWVRFRVQQVAATAQRPHGLDYSLTLHGPDNARLVGFDNAHQVGSERRVEHDHKHRLRGVRPYDFEDAASLVADFWAEVEAVMREKGVWR
jgi:hypothetical protein